MDLQHGLTAWTYRSGELHAINAITGKACRDFGDQGIVNLSTDVGNEELGEYGVTSPPAEINNSIVVGSAIGDNRATGELLIALEERPVPASDVPGETLSPTQPFSGYPPFTSYDPLTEEDAFGLLWFDKLQ